MDIIPNLVTRPPSRPGNPNAVEKLDKLDRATENIFAAQLQTRLQELQRTQSPPRRLTPLAIYARAYAEIASEGPLSDIDSRSSSTTPSESSPKALIASSHGTHGTSLSPSSTNTAECDGLKNRREEPENAQEPLVPSGPSSPPVSADGLNNGRQPENAQGPLVPSDPSSPLASAHGHPTQKRKREADAALGTPETVKRPCMARRPGLLESTRQMVTSSVTQTAAS
ncbi:hypothetical protein EPUS_08069 [Endocarpon pusillum Z07020]|uniref:Uncharacterized protein n=1 Tax=Endocarpon pusillum (strain Z07020 / HMAS-L-300199) TaxID=1263415 RepID=U1HJ17_ENDPU|nr:uncharacterized protein EPUS_08069 [Endocarpon pusillum Z07020]ERF68909.1 hypothetical protein EPUS_08069 [Endocarpon pusillum Z07020]